MKILVCVKQVLESGVALQLEPDGGVSPRGVPRFQFNRYDEFALEEAVRIGEALPGTRVEAITVGPGEARAVLVRAVGVGAAHGIHVRVDERGEASRAEAVAGWIAACARDRELDLVLCGVMSEDLMRGQVGPLLAERLGWPCATAVVAANVLPGQGRVVVARELEAGWRERLELALPAVLTVQSGINQPRYPTLSNLLRAKRQSWEEVAAAEIAVPPPTLEPLRAVRPLRSRRGLVLEGDGRTKARALLELLARRSLLAPAGERR